MSLRPDRPTWASGPATGSAGPQGWLAAVRLLADWICRSDELARQRRALARLDDRLLMDVGLTREQANREIDRLSGYL
jgi:uncharacterized protein YjiS (DUF1127 family)